mmetsp:Transcript_98464/g.317450  ORF Transcript_98464/g.317450 Transcript_98464/m.317450 type:complete len:433 (-) Transcript_98464:135-1433(-)
MSAEEAARPQLPLGPRPRAVLSEEVLALCALLQPQDLAQFICATSWGTTAKDRQATWRAYFVLCWGAEHDASRNTQVCLMRSWAWDAWPAPRPLAVGFCGARSSLDHLFWFLPVFRAIFGVGDTRRRLPPPPLAGWQAACRVRAGPAGVSRLARCFLCDIIEVTPPGPAPQHFRQRWMRPCASCPHLAHRTCLEQQLARASAVAGTDAALRCRACGREYNSSRRFPETLSELLAATMLEWRWLLRRLFACLVFFVWLYTLAEHYCVLNGVSKELCVLLAFTASIMSISVTQRFHRGIQMIWNTPHRCRYFQVFGLFAGLFYMVSLRAFDPSRLSVAATEWPWLAVLHEVHKMIHGSLLGTLVFSSISLLYAATASGVIFLFWKTSLRVPTVADVDVPEESSSRQHGPGTPRSEGCAQCGLCQLGLCLDNPCM